MAKEVSISLIVDASGAIQGIRAADGALLKLVHTTDKASDKTEDLQTRLARVEHQLKGGTVASVSQADAALRTLREAFDHAVTENDRARFARMTHEVQKIRAGFVQTGKGVDDAGEKTSRVGRIFEFAIGNLAASAVYRLQNAMFNLVRGGFRMLGQSMQEAGIAQITERRLEQALRNLGDASGPARDRIRDVANEIQRTSNFSDDAVKTAGALLASFKSVGSSEGIATLLPRLADMAAGVARVTGETVDLNQVATAVGKSLDGNAASLRRYGVSLSEAEAEQLDAAQGMDKIRILAGILDNNFKGLAKAAADPFVQFRNQVGELKEQLGGELLPVAQDVVRQLIEMAQRPDTAEFVRKVGKQMADSLLEGIELLKATIEWLQKYGDDVVKGAKVLAVLTIAIKTWSASMVLANVQLRVMALMARGYTLAQATMNVAVMAGQRAWTAFTAAIASNPIGALATVLSVAVSALILFRKGTDEATEALRRQREEAVRLRGEIDKLSGAMAAQETIRIGLDITANTETLREVRSQMKELEKQGKAFTTTGAMGTSVRVMTTAYSRLVLQEKELLETLKAQNVTRAETERRARSTLTGQMAFTEHEITRLQDRAQLTETEQKRLTEIHEARMRITDDARLTTDEQKRQLKLLDEEERRIRSVATSRAPAARLQALEQERALIQEQIDARERLAGLEAMGSGGGGATTPDGGDLRQALAKEREMLLRRQELAVELMQDGLPKVLAQIDLQVDREIQRYWEQYSEAAPELYARVREKLEEEREKFKIAVVDAMRLEDFVDGELPTLPPVMLPLEIDLKTLDTSAKNAFAEIERELGQGMTDSIKEVDDALQTLYTLFDAATTANARDEIQKLIDKLLKLRDTMSIDWARILNDGLNDAAEQAVQSFAEGLGEIMAGTDRVSESIRQVDDNLETLQVALRGADKELAALHQRMEDADSSREREQIQAQIEALEAQRAAIRQNIADQEQLKSSLENTNKILTIAKDAVLGALADMAIKVGRIAVMTGIAIEGIKKALESMNPFVAVAAGIALIALGTWVKASLAKAAQGPGSVSAPSAAGAGGDFSSSGDSDTKAGVVVDVPGKEEGGLVRGPEQLIRVNEQGEEFVVPAGPTRRYLQALEAMRQGESPAKVISAVQGGELEGELQGELPAFATPYGMGGSGGVRSAVQGMGRDLDDLRVRVDVELEHTVKGDLWKLQSELRRIEQHIKRSTGES